MKETVKIRNIELGSGLPKIIVPVVAKSVEDIGGILKTFEGHHYDMVELRGDHLENGSDFEVASRAISAVRGEMPDIPLIYTYRTTEEGGTGDIDREEYEKLLTEIAEKCDVDVIDVEMSCGVSVFKHIVNRIHEFGGKVIGSSHDFKKTPFKGDIIYRLAIMQDNGADISKAAVMPSNPEDVLELLQASYAASLRLEKPFIALAMGHDGVISRIACEVFGSAATFGVIDKASAPGQIDSDILGDMIKTISEQP